MNTLRRIVTTSAAAFLLLASGFSAFAEDIDLFAGNSATGDDIPTVLLYIHSQSNVSSSATHTCTYDDDGDGVGDGTSPRAGQSVLGMEQCAIVNALTAVKANPQLVGRLKVGVMVFNNKNTFSGHDNGNPDIGTGEGECGYLLFPPKKMDAAGIDALVAQVKTYDKNSQGGAIDITSNDSAVGDGFASAWAALNGLVDKCGGNNIDYSKLGNDSTDCQDAVIVYVGNLAAQSASADDKSNAKGRVDALLQAALKDDFGYATNSQQYQLFTSAIPVSGFPDKGVSQADDWARFMKRVNTDDSTQSDSNITTYTVGVTSDKFAKPGLEAYLAEIAKQGGGKAFKVDSSAADAFRDVLIQIFTEVQAVNSVFSSATLPVSANTQGTFLNQVYIAMFRPDALAGPRWFGNVKQYQLGFDSGGNIALADAEQDISKTIVAATNPNNGAISDAAVSFWTTNDPNPSITSEWPDTGYWINSPDGVGLQFDKPDGDLVEKGGAAQMLRVDNISSQDNRKVYSCASVGGCGSSGATLTPFTVANFGSTDFGLSASGGGATTVKVGSKLSAVVDYTCVNTETNKNKPPIISCTFSSTVPGVFPSMQVASGSGKKAVAGDAVHIDGIGQTDCTTTSPCEITTAGTNSFTVQLNSMPEGTRSAAAITLYHYSTVATVNENAHGYTAGEQIELRSCTEGTGFNHNTNQVATATGVFIANVEAVLSANSYQVNLANVALAENNITCGQSSATLTADNLIKWIRGEDLAGNEVLEGPCPLNSDNTRTDNQGNTCTYSARPSIHGDVLHSRPAVINYGDIDGDNPSGETDVVVFYGSNDGMFRAINGNQTRNISGVRPGGELWSFIAPDFFKQFPRLFSDDPKVKYPGSADPDAERRDYFMDGTTTFLQDNRAADASIPTAGKKYVFLTARRGGALVYALDVTDPTTPKYLWSKSKSDIPELGETWSQPQVASISGHSNPVLIFGAGYDPAEDADPAPATTDIDEGRGIIVLDAADGSLVWAALASCTGVTGATSSNCVDNSTLTDDLLRPIPADIRLFDNDFDGKVDRLYAADLGGNIWRVDLEPLGNTAPANWKITKFASLAGSGNDARKFFYPPDVVPTKNYDIVVAVSGDREKPLASSSTTAGIAHNVNNRFYLLVDRNGGNNVASGTATITESNLLDRTETKCFTASNTVVACSYNETNDRYEDSSGNPVTLATLKQISANLSGYYITLEGGSTIDGDSDGEKGINAPLAVAGKVYFGTNQPGSVALTGACAANLGIARGYKIDLFTGEAGVPKIFPGGGMPPSPIAGLVTIDGITVPFIIGGEGPTPFDPSTPQLDLSGGRQRTYWYYQ